MPHTPWNRHKIVLQIPLPAADVLARICEAEGKTPHQLLRVALNALFKKLADEDLGPDLKGIPKHVEQPVHRKVEWRRCRICKQQKPATDMLTQSSRTCKSCSKSMARYSKDCRKTPEKYRAYQHFYRCMVREWKELSPYTRPEWSKYLASQMYRRGEYEHLYYNSLRLATGQAQLSSEDQ